MAEVRSLLDELRLQLMAAQSDKAMLESTFETEKAELLRTIHEKIDEKTVRAAHYFSRPFVVFHGSHANSFETNRRPNLALYITFSRLNC